MDFLIEYKFVNILEKLSTSKISMNSQVDEFDGLLFVNFSELLLNLRFIFV